MMSSRNVQDNTETVVLLHGLGLGPWSMKRIEWALRSDGYHVLNIKYSSLKKDIAALAEETLAPVFAHHDSKSPLYFVTHSMGSILLRKFLNDHPESIRPKRVVMMGPPNHGSEIIDFLQKFKVSEKIIGPAGIQLGTNSRSIPNGLSDFYGSELGVIAGSLSFNPLFSKLFGQRSDGRVSIKSTYLGGMTDHIVMRTSHTWMLWRKPVIRQIRAFLLTGKFEKNK
jgi:triacylglycerol lipase